MNLCNSSCPSQLVAAEASELLMAHWLSSPLGSLIGPCWSRRPAHRTWCVTFLEALEGASVKGTCGWMAPRVLRGEVEVLGEGKGHSLDSQPLLLVHAGW